MNSTTLWGRIIEIIGILIMASTVLIGASGYRPRATLLTVVSGLLISAAGSLIARYGETGDIRDAAIGAGREVVMILIVSAAVGGLQLLRK